MIERYTTKSFAHLFDDEARYQAYLDVEIAAVEAWAKLGVVPETDLLAIQKKAHIDVKRIAELEAITRHDVVAFTRQVGETLGPEKKWIHYGLTSTDVVDTSLGLLYQKADDIIEKDLETLLASIKEKALDYENTPCIARTHDDHPFGRLRGGDLDWRFGCGFIEFLRRGDRLRFPFISVQHLGLLAHPSFGGVDGKSRFLYPLPYHLEKEAD